MLTSIVSVLQSNHPGFFDRMEGYCETRFLINPVDIPFVFLFTPNPENPTIEPFWGADSLDWDVKVSGRLRDLVDLFEGRVDGDALFFSRALAVEGDTSGILALRNAIDSEEIKLIAEITAKFGPLQTPLRIVGENGPAIVSKAYDFIENIRDRISEPVVSPIRQNTKKLREEIERLKSDVSTLRSKALKPARATK